MISHAALRRRVLFLPELRPRLNDLRTLHAAKQAQLAPRLGYRVVAINTLLWAVNSGSGAHLGDAELKFTHGVIIGDINVVRWHSDLDDLAAELYLSIADAMHKFRP